MRQMMDEPDVIKLILFQGTGSIWNIKDWRRVRSYKIFGKFIGSLAQQPYQVKEKGFPLILTKNETTFLIEKSVAVLVCSRNLHSSPDLQLINLYTDKQYNSFINQSILMQKERKLEVLSMTDIIIAGKLKKRLKLDPNYVMGEIERATIIQDEISKISNPSESYMFIEISTEDPWLKNTSWEKVNWTYPTTEDEQLGYATYRSLCQMDFCVTSGAKFGGNFLAYRGDPLQIHSSYIVRCNTRAQVLELHEIITLSRLATSTNKIPVLAYLDDNKKIKFQSLSWVN